MIKPTPSDIAEKINADCERSFVFNNRQRQISEEAVKNLNIKKI
jgi:hypothetical protein